MIESQKYKSNGKFINDINENLGFKCDILIN